MLLMVLYEMCIVFYSNHQPLGRFTLVNMLWRQKNYFVHKFIVSFSVVSAVGFIGMIGLSGCLR
jgi:hypothetical protein